MLAGWKENRTATGADAEDPELRGRTYAIPFEQVWQATVGLAGGGLRSWNLVNADDQRGVVEAQVRGGRLRPELYVRVHVGLDENAQTRLDLFARTQDESGSRGRTRRQVIRFLRRLDDRLGARPDQILDPDALPRLGTVR